MRFRLPLSLTLLACLALLGSFSSLLWAQEIDLQPERFRFEIEDLPVDQSIPSPQRMLGYPLGDRMTVYHQVVAYAQKLSEASVRVSMHEYGETHEGRPLVYLVITHADNHQRLEEIRQNSLKLADAKHTSEAEAQEIIEKDPVVVSYSYNIHGNEASSTEAAMQVAYHLAAAKDAATDDLLKEVVFVAFITVNPDGRDRYAYWYNSVAKNQVGLDPAELEHDAPWPNGRTNHYWFDLNRDWIWGVHPEMRGLTEVYQQWMPQLHVDYHEQGYNSNYFTMPGTTPRNKLLPDAYEAYSDTIGMANAAFFDQNKLNYFTREAFDFFYPGYGSSYPSVNGAIGMLTEQGGIGAGRAVTTNDGYVLSFRQRIFDHYNTSLATLRKAVERKQMFQRYTYEANNPKNSKSAVKAYIFTPDEHGFLHEVLDILLHHKVEVYQSKQELRLRRTSHYPSKQTQSATVPAGSFVVPTDQARHLLINSILLQEMAIEDSVMYDMSTWSAPLAYNLDTYASYEPIASDQLERVLDVPDRSSAIVGDAESAYAFVIEWKQRHAPKALSMLWKKGYRVRLAKKSFGDGSSSFGAGSLIVLAGRNLEKSQTMAADMQEIANKAHVQVYAMASGRMQQGIDLASNSAQPLKMPKVAMLVDEPFNTYSSGFMYHLLDQDVELPFSRIRSGSLRQSATSGVGGARYGSADLNKYDVLILPPANRLNRIFDSKTKPQLLEWVRNGGVLVLNGRSATHFAADSTFGIALKKEVADVASAKQAAHLSFEERERFFGLQRIPGTAMLATIDNSDPLGFGMSDQFYSLRYTEEVLKPESGLYGTARFNGLDNLHVSGYASEQDLSHIAEGVMAGWTNYGQGKVIFILDDTQYRMFWRGGQRLLLNAVMLGKTF